MARPLRIERLGGWYHVTARGNERRAIYRGAGDRRHWLELAGEMAERFNLAIHAYVLMDNHYHLMLELREPSLSAALQWLNVSYAVWFNRRHDRSGHLFQGRFKSVAVEPEGWAWELTRYIHLNPVRVKRLGLDKDGRAAARSGFAAAPSAEVAQRRLTQLRAYPWSSYRAYVGSATPPGWLTCENILASGAGRGNRRQRYRQYVEMAVRQGLPSSPWEQLKEQVILGSAAFVQQIRTALRVKEAQPLVGRLAPRPGWPQIVAVVEAARQESWAQFAERHSDKGRDLALYLGRKEGRLTLSALARHAGLHSAAAVNLAIKRYERLLPGSPAERQRVKACLRGLDLKELLNV